MARRRPPAFDEQRFALSGIVHLVIGCALLVVCVLVFVPTLGAGGGEPILGALVALGAAALGWVYIRSHGRVRELRLTDQGIVLDPAGVLIRWEDIKAVSQPGLGLPGQQRRMAPRALRFTLDDRSFRWEPGRWMQFAGTGRLHLLGGDTRQITSGIMARLAAQADR